MTVKVMGRVVRNKEEMRAVMAVSLECYGVAQLEIGDEPMNVYSIETVLINSVAAAVGWTYMNNRNRER